MRRLAAVLGGAAALLLTSGCQGVPAEAPSARLSTSPNGTASAVAASPSAVAASPVAPASPAAADILVDTRLFGLVPFTSRPRAVIDPRTATTPPHYEKDGFAWTPRKTFDGWLADLAHGTFQFGVSIHEADGLLPSLKGATVADVGAGYGNNLLAWKQMLGPQGRLVETELDLNSAHFMAYVAHVKGYDDNTLVLNSVFERPCLPVARFDLVLCSQLHSHITVGPYPRNHANERIFREQSATFLGDLRRSLKDDGSLLVVIEGLQNYDGDPKRLYLKKPEAVANIVANGFTLVDARQNDHMWVATFHRARGQ